MCGVFFFRHFIYFWLHGVFTVVQAFPSCGEQGLLFSVWASVAERRLWASVAVVPGLGCSKARLRITAEINAVFLSAEDIVDRAVMYKALSSVSSSLEQLCIDGIPE